jgi:hypothetical protein
VEEIKEITIANGFKNEKGVWVLENGIVKANVSSLIKVKEASVSYLQSIGRDDLIAMNPFTTREDLSKIMGEEEMLQKELISYIYTLRVNKKD